MTGLELLAIVGPIITFAGLVWKAYASAKKNIAAFADNLVSNHAQHIQDSTERAAKAVTELAGYHKDMLESQRGMLVSLDAMRQDFHEHVKDDLRVQTDILTKLEVIDTKVT